MGTFLAMTSNGEVNFVLAQRAAEEFKPPRVLAVFPRDPQANISVSNKVNQAFIPDLAIKTWNEYLNDGRVKLGTTTLDELEFSTQCDRIQEKIRTGVLIPLLVERSERLQVVPANQDWEIGDRIIYLLHDPRPSLLKRLSGATQSTPLSLEKLPEVEDLSLAQLSQLSTSEASGG
jgi:Trk K+ transport system NAD-binding subunit